MMQPRNETRVGRVALLVLCLLSSLPNSSFGQSSALTPISDVTITSAATLVRGGSAFRTSLSCTNHDATVHVRWGNEAITSTKGQRIPAGASAEINTKAPIYMISEGASVTVSCTEETK